MPKPKKVTFIPVHRKEKYGAILPPVKPAKAYIPKWYKDAEQWLGGGPKIEGYQGNAALKACVPFLDTLTSGYILQLNQDVQVTRGPKGSTPKITWLIQPDPIMLRSPELGRTIPRPAGHDDDHWAWVTQFGIKVPIGYSVLVTHPLNRFDLPFTTLTGIMDSDIHFTAGNLPFFLHSDFEGIIPDGTPIAQIIPIKRDKWTSETSYDEDLAWKSSQLIYDSRRVLSGYYKKNSWSKKYYE